MTPRKKKPPKPPAPLPPPPQPDYMATEENIVEKHNLLVDGIRSAVSLDPLVNYYAVLRSEVAEKHNALVVGLVNLGGL